MVKIETRGGFTANQDAQVPPPHRLHQMSKCLYLFVMGVSGGKSLGGGDEEELKLRGVCIEEEFSW